MVDQETLEKIEKFMQQYQYNWGKEVDLRNCAEITCATCAGYFFEGAGQKT